MSRRLPPTLVFATAFVLGSSIALTRDGAFGANAANPKSGAGAASAPQPDATKIEDLRNARYCEVLTVARRRLTFTVSVFNTIGLNSCPARQWSALDAKALAKAQSVTLVKLNGPRYWTLDAIEGRGMSARGQTAEFGASRWACAPRSKRTSGKARSATNSTPQTRSGAKRSGTTRPAARCTNSSPLRETST